MKRRVRIDNGLIDELNQFALTIKIGAATKIRDDLTQTTQSAILSFYDHYSPISYQRTDKHRNSLNSFHKYYVNPHNMIIRGGVELSPEEMGQLYRVDKEYVFNEVYLGMHGNVKMLPNYSPEWHTPPMMTPDPLTIIQDRRDWIVGHIVSYTKSSVQKAQNNNYEYIRFK